MADDEPVPFPDADWPDRVLKQTRIDLVPTVLEIPQQRLTLAEGVPDRLAQRVLGQHRRTHSVRIQLQQAAMQRFRKRAVNLSITHKYQPSKIKKI